MIKIIALIIVSVILCVLLLTKNDYQAVDQTINITPAVAAFRVSDGNIKCFSYISSVGVQKTECKK